MKHTPGPWHGRPSHDPVLLQGADEVGLSIAFACGGGNPKRAEYVANARLIAAAPELLEALRYVLSAHGEQLDDAFTQAHAAIRKATGDA